MKPNRAATLIEMITVIAIISVLCALLLPVLMQAKGKARQSACVSNQHQMATMLQMYADDHNGLWPEPDTWIYWGRSHKGADNPTCPQKPPYTTDIEQKAFGVLPGYNMNAFLMWEGMFSPFGPNKGIQVPYPATTILIGDGSRTGAAFADTDVCLSWFPTMMSHVDDCHQKNPDHGWERHNGGANYTFVDGHTKWLKREQIKSAFVFEDGKPVYKPTGNDGTTPAFMVDAAK